MTTRADMLFDAEMSAKYHRRRASFLERSSALMSAALLFGGAAAFASLFSQQTLFAKGLTALIALIGVIQIVFRVDDCAAKHRQWLREWNRMLAEIRKSDSPTSQQIAVWEAQKYSIEADCVGEMRALQEDCYNRTMIALGRIGTPRKLTLWQRMWMQVYSFENSFQN